MDCFNSTDRDAVNASLLYDNNNDEENLWMRGDTAGPLGSCSPLRPLQSACTVCLHDGTVYAVCEKLADGARVVMEAIGKSVSISESDCPAPPGDAQQAGIIVAPLLLLLLLLLLLVIFITGVLLYRRYCKNRPVQTRNGIQNPQEVRTAEQNHSPPLLSGCDDGSQQHPGGLEGRTQ